MTRDLILLVADRDTGEVMQAGKPSGLQIVPKEQSKEIADALKAFESKSSYLSHPDVPYHGTVTGDSAEKWQQRWLDKRYKAMLSASHVDLSGAEVKLPDNVFVANDIGSYYHGWNACLEKITAQMKGE